MKLFPAILRYELMLQLRSPRFRLAVLGYLTFCAAPSGLLYFAIRHHTDEQLGPASYLSQTLQVQPYLTALLVVLVAGNRSSAEALRENWSVLAASAMSNAGFLARRWLALVALIVPLAMVPQAVSLGFALAAGNRSVDATTWVGSWCLAILPIVVAFTAYWLACVTITGGELGAVVSSLVILPMLIAAANQLLLRFHLTLAGYLEIFSLRSLSYWIYWTLAHWGATENRYNMGYMATEAPFDLTSAVGQILPAWALIIAVGALFLSLAAAFVRRTRRDLQPRPVPDEHQLRTFLHKLNRARERYAPDGGLGAPERIALVVGLAIFSVAMFGWIHRQLEMHELARLRYEAETAGGFDPLPAEVDLTTWAIRGRLDRDGRVEVDVSGRLENQGAVPLEELAFSLNQALAIDHMSAGSHQVTAVRAWDRLMLRLDPPLAPGDGVELGWRLSGVPESVHFHFGRGRGDMPFAMMYEGLMNARFPRDLSDLSRSTVRRAISPRRIHLGATDLTPLPRRTSWTLTPPDGGGDSVGTIFGREVPPEVGRNRVELELDLDAPPEWFLADTCGHASAVEGGRTRLKGVCQTSLTELLVAGGRLEAARSGDSGSTSLVTLASLHSHRRQATAQLEALARVASLSHRAWPGMPGLENLVVLEWPPRANIDLRRGMSLYDRLRSRLIGRLLFLPERLFADDSSLEPENLVAQLLSRDLLERRALAKDQDVLFRHFFRALMVRRMGLDGEGGATVSGKPWLRQALQTPILSAQPEYGYIWKRRLPAVLAQMESRIGGDHFYAGIESFLAAGGETPGTIEELLAELERRSGISLERTYQDHFQGDALPLLRLEEVRSTRRGDGWLVEGMLRNTGSGEAVCPVIVKTEIAELKLTVTVDTETASSFSVRSDHRPHTVLLDPERTCYRFLLRTSPALERVNLLD